MLDDIQKDAESRMKKTAEATRDEMNRIRTGRASTALLDHLTVDYYGTATPVNQVATVAVADARTLTIQPWEKKMLAAVEKAILESELGLNPVTAGTVIRVPLPPMTEERPLGTRQIGEARRRKRQGRGAQYPPRRDPHHARIIEGKRDQRRPRKTRRSGDANLDRPLHRRHRRNRRRKGKGSYGDVVMGGLPLGGGGGGVAGGGGGDDGDGYGICDADDGDVADRDAAAGDGDAGDGYGIVTPPT